MFLTVLLLTEIVLLLAGTMSLPWAGDFLVPVHLHSEHDQGNQEFEPSALSCSTAKLGLSSVTLPGWFTEQMYSTLHWLKDSARCMREQMAGEGWGISLGSTNLPLGYHTCAPESMLALSICCPKCQFNLEVKPIFPRQLPAHRLCLSCVVLFSIVQLLEHFTGLVHIQGL